MRLNSAVGASMVLLALVLIGSQTHAFFTSGKQDNDAHGPALKASIVETLRYLEGPRKHEDPPSPFNRGVPGVAIESDVAT